jgi:hypothetical protein
LKYLPSWLPGGSYKRWVRPWDKEGKLLMYGTYERSKKSVVRVHGLLSAIG